MSDWSKNKRVFDRFVEPHSYWLHDCKFDFRCNFKTRSGCGDMRTANSAALTTSFDDLIHKSLKDEQTGCIMPRRIISLEEAVLPVLPTGFGNSVITGGQPDNAVCSRLNIC